MVEATCTYWDALAVTLHAADYHVAVVHPAHIHAYGQSLPHRAKTDPLDVPVLARFAVDRQPSPWTPPPAVYHDLHQRLVARDALVTMRTQARNQRHALLQWLVVIAAVEQQFDAVIADLDRRVATLDAALTTALTAGAWAHAAQWISTRARFWSLDNGVVTGQHRKFHALPHARGARGGCWPCPVCP